MFWSLIINFYYKIVKFYTSCMQEKLILNKEIMIFLGTKISPLLTLVRSEINAHLFYHLNHMMETKKSWEIFDDETCYEGSKSPAIIMCWQRLACLQITHICLTFTWLVPQRENAELHPAVNWDGRNVQPPCLLVSYFNLYIGIFFKVQSIKTLKPQWKSEMLYLQHLATPTRYFST